MYDYEKEKPKLFTEGNSRMLIVIRDHALRLTKEAGAVSMGALLDAGGSGDSWTMMACVDRLVEMGDLIEVPRSEHTPGQHRIFVRVGR